MKTIFADRDEMSEKSMNQKLFERTNIKISVDMEESIEKIMEPFGFKKINFRYMEVPRGRNSDSWEFDLTFIREPDEDNSEKIKAIVRQQMYSRGGHYYLVHLDAEPFQREVEFYRLHETGNIQNEAETLELAVCDYLWYRRQKRMHLSINERVADGSPIMSRNRGKDRVKHYDG